MQIKVDANNRIVGYALLGGCPDGIEIDESALPQGFFDEDSDGFPLFWPGKWKYENGKVTETGEAKPEPQNPTASLEQQIADLQLAVVELYEEVLGNG